MTKSQMYTQCTLVRDHKDGTRSLDEVWIQTEFAVVGKRLSIKKPNWSPPTWENGFVVVARGATRSEESLREYERDHLHQREASDI